MAVEINSKKLHKHAVPVVLMLTAFIMLSAVALTQYKPGLSRGLEALFGQHGSSGGYIKDVSDAGLTSKNIISQ